MSQLELQHVSIERDRAIHVAHEEVDEIGLAHHLPRPPEHGRRRRGARHAPPRLHDADPAVAGAELLDAREERAPGRSPRAGIPRRARRPIGSRARDRARRGRARRGAAVACTRTCRRPPPRPRRPGATSAWRYAISPARRAATASPQCRLSRLGASWLQPTPSTQTAACRPRSSAASTVTTQPSVLRAACSLVSGSNSGVGSVDIRVGGARVRRGVSAVPHAPRPRSPPRVRPLSCRYRRISRPGHGERRNAERPVEHRIEREALDPAVRDHVATPSSGPRPRRSWRSPRSDQHHGGRDREQPVGRPRSGPVAGPRRAGRARTRRRCSCPLRSPRRRTRTSRSRVRGSMPASA